MVFAHFVVGIPLPSNVEKKTLSFNCRKSFLSTLKEGGREGEIVPFTVTKITCIQSQQHDTSFTKMPLSITLSSVQFTNHTKVLHLLVLTTVKGPTTYFHSL